MPLRRAYIAVFGRVRRDSAALAFGLQVRHAAPPSCYPGSSTLVQRDLSQRPSVMSQGLFVAAVPSFGYVLAYLRELGFFLELKIPFSFIHVALTEVLAMTVALVGVLVVLVWGADALLTFVWQDKVTASFVHRVIRSVLIPFLVVVLVWALPDTSSLLLLVAGGCAAGLVLIDFLHPLLTQRRVSGYQAKLAAAGREERLTPLLKLVLRRLAPTDAWLIGMVVLLLVAALSLGTSRARSQEWYLVTEDQPSLVVIRHYGDTALAAGFDRESKVLERRFSLISLPGARGEETVLRLERIGPLEAAPSDD